MRKIIIFGSSSKTSIEKKFFFEFKKINKSTKIYDTDLHFPKIFKFKFINKIFLFPRILFNSIFMLIICFNTKNCLVLVFKGQFFSSFIIKYLKKKNNHYFINFNGDDPFNFSIIDISTKYLIKSLKEYNLVLIWSKRILKKIKAQKISNKIEYLPFGYDKMITSFNSKKIRKRVIFYGSWDKHRENFLNKIKLNDLYIFGSGWEHSSEKFFHHKNIVSKEINRGQIIKEISRSYAVINIFRNQNYGSHNMKTFEIPAYGGIQFSQYSKEVSSFFKKNKSIFFYSSAGDLVKKLKKFKKSNSFGIFIKNSLKDVKNQSYKKRVNKILEYVKKHKYK